MTRLALYPGTFDPITNGHSDLACRAAKLFDEVVVAVADDSSKSPLFSLNERVELVKQVMNKSNIRVIGFSGLLIDCLEEIGTNTVIRGLRAVSDFEYEVQLAAMNRRLKANIETVFLTPAENYTFLSATMVKEVARLGGDISSFVHPTVAKVLQERYPSRS